MPRNKKLASARPRFALLFCLAVSVGCGYQPPFKTVPVSGKVSYTDGTPIQEHELYVKFVPQVEPNGKDHARQGIATVKPDGTFSDMTTWKVGDGATVGKQKVLVTATGKEMHPSAAVPPIYSDPATTPLTCEVTPGCGPFDFKVEKPAPAAGRKK